jgi:uncharacterized membrane protein required for colicin V production
MIAVAAQSFDLDKLPIGWFDIVLVAVLAFGIYRGRRNGMTKEVLPMLQVVTTVIVGALGYELVGQLLISYTKLDKTPGFVLGYLLCAFVVFIVFLILKKFLTPWLTGSNLFGSAEYYLAIFSGMIRFAGLLLIALALLHAPFYSAADIASSKAFNARWFGGGLQGFNGDFFPTLQTVQEGVFQKSFTGRGVNDYLGAVLITTAPAAGATAPVKTPIIHFGN